MKKKLLSLLLCAAMCTPVMAGLSACGGKDDGMEITVWCSDVAGIKALTETQIKRFNEKNPDFKVKAKVAAVSEKKAAGDMEKYLNTTAADLFFFAQDQFARLVEVSALTMTTPTAGSKVVADNVDWSVEAASTSDGTLFAYPLTTDNTFFMYYNKDMISADKVEYLEDIISVCEAGGHKISFPLGAEQSWYSAAFFFGTGCKSEWEVDSDGAFKPPVDDFNSDKGKKAVAGMKKVLGSSAYLTTYGGAADFSASVPSAVVIGGTWDYQIAKSALGDKLGIAKLPKWKGADNEEFQLKPFAACKLLGVKPQKKDAKRAAALRELALFLTNEDCQKERYEQFKWRPTNKKLLADTEILNDEYIKIVNYNIENGVKQGQIPELWWGYADSIALEAKAGTKTVDEILSDYETKIKSIVSE